MGHPVFSCISNPKRTSAFDKREEESWGGTDTKAIENLKKARIVEVQEEKFQGPQEETLDLVGTVKKRWTVALTCWYFSECRNGISLQPEPCPHLAWRVRRSAQQRNDFCQAPPASWLPHWTHRYGPWNSERVFVTMWLQAYSSIQTTNFPLVTRGLERIKYYNGYEWIRTVSDAGGECSIKQLALSESSCSSATPLAGSSSSAWGPWRRSEFWLPFCGVRSHCWLRTPMCKVHCSQCRHKTTKTCLPDTWKDVNG